MTTTPDNEKFASWRRALDGDLLTPAQHAVLEEMVTTGEADTLQAAADMLDWQDGRLNAPSHMWGN